MKYWKQLEEDAFEYYGGFSKDKDKKIMQVVPNLQVFTINGALIDRHEFINKCADDIKDLFSIKSELSRYKFYLIANVEIRDKNSKIEKYKRVWKLLQNKWSLDKFKKGIEVERCIGDKSYYCSVAEFIIEDISIALEIIAANPYEFTIIASKNDGLLTESWIEDIFNIMFEKTDTKFPKIDYCDLCLHLCPLGDIVFRLGDSAEEITLGLISKGSIKL